MVSTTWEDAFHFASDLWGASLGARVVSGDVSYRAVPLLFVLLLIGLTKLLLLQGRRFSPASQWMAIPGFTVTALLLAGGIGTHVSVWGALPLAILIPLIAAAWEVALAPKNLELRFELPRWVSLGVRTGWRASWALAVYGGFFLLLSVIVSWSQIRGIDQLLLSTSAVDSIMIVLAVFTLVAMPCIRRLLLPLGRSRQFRFSVRPPQAPPATGWSLRWSCSA